MANAGPAEEFPSELIGDASLMLRDLVVRALELMEGAGLEELAEARRKTFDRRKALTAAQVRRRLKLG